MKYRIKVADTAWADLQEATDYIEYVLMNPEAANALTEKVLEKIASLEELPNRYQTVYDAVLKRCGIRSISIDNYLLFYIVSDADQTVHVVRFLYAKRNWAGLLGIHSSIN